MNRREFFPALGLGLLSLLVHNNQILARQRTLADFLSHFDAIYDPNQEWGFGEGRLLCGINGQMGDLLIYVDDTWVSHSVDSVTFDHNRQRVMIARNDQRIFSYDPRLRTSPYPLH